MMKRTMKIKYNQTCKFSGAGFIGGEARVNIFLSTIFLVERLLFPEVRQTDLELVLLHTGLVVILFQ